MYYTTTNNFLVAIQNIIKIKLTKQKIEVCREFQHIFKTYFYTARADSLLVTIHTYKHVIKMSNLNNNSHNLYFSNLKIVFFLSQALCLQFSRFCVNVYAGIINVKIQMIVTCSFIFILNANQQKLNRLKVCLVEKVKQFQNG